MSLSDNNKADVIEAINSNARYIDDLLNVDKKVSEYDQEIPQSHTTNKPTSP